MMRLVLALAVGLGLALPASALNGQAGTSGAEFLKLGAGGRAGGMGDAFSAIADDVYAAYYNPAGLAQLRSPELGGAHTAYFQGINYEVVDFAYPWGIEKDYTKNALSFGVYQLSVSGIQRFVAPSAGGSDSTEAVGTFGASDAAYGLSYAHGFSRQLSAGGTVKFISQSLDTYRSSAYTFDGGVLYRLNPDAKRPVNLAATVKNLNLGLSRPGFTTGNSDPFPTEFTAGVAVDAVPTRLKMTLEIAEYRDTNPFATLGGEWTTQFNEAIGTAFRFGYNTLRRDNPGLNGASLGAGINFRNKASFDFAWVPFGTLGDTFRYSILVKF